MKEIKKMVETVIGYKAEDGKQFSTKEECEAYEKRLEDKKRIFEDIINGMVVANNSDEDILGIGSDCYVYKVIKPQYNNIEILKQYCLENDIPIFDCPTSYNYGVKTNVSQIKPNNTYYFSYDGWDETITGLCLYLPCEDIITNYVNWMYEKGMKDEVIGLFTRILTKMLNGIDI